ncbi:MAG: hypothetical protein L6437_09335, partial [Kiritimatiellae bacterium]|nr:hypothetical protein [Kiritimatiellia bacterium]
DAVKLYWHVQEQGYFLFPSVVHLIYSPDEVAQARQGDWQFYVLPKLQDYQRPPILSKDVDKVVAGLYETCSFPAARPGYASSGPKILNYQLINPGKSDLSLKENERQRMRFDVHADKGLKEVLLQDGQKMVRRWLPKGNDFSKTLDLFHDQQRQYILVVTDQQGGKCISHVIGTSVQTHGFFMNGDNQNVRDGSCWQGVPAEGDEESLQAATDPALQMGGPPVGIEAYSPAGKQISSHFGFFGVIDGKYQGLDTDIRAMDHVCRLAGEFCVIRDGIVRNLYPRSHPNSVYGYSGKTFAPMYPTQYIDWMTRGYSFASVLSGPPGELVCFIKKDIVAPKEQFVLIASMPLEKIVIRPDGKGRVLMETVRAGSYRGGEGKLEYGDYVASFDIGQVTQEGGFISAQKDGWPLYYKIVSSSRPGSSRIYLYSKSPNPGETLKAGAELRWRYYLSVGPRTLQPNNRRFEELRGRLLGKAPYQCDPKVGKVLDAGVALSVEADHGGFAAGFKGSTEDIALIVNGLNERWSAGVWHKGETPIRYYTKDYYGTWQVKCLRRKETDAIRRFGVWEGKGYYVVEKGDRDVFAGNFIVCDNPEIVLALVHATKDRKEVVVHNPTDKAVTVTVTPAPGFMLFGDFKKVLTIEAGQDEMLKL